MTRAVASRGTVLHSQRAAARASVVLLAALLVATSSAFGEPLTFTSIGDGDWNATEGVWDAGGGTIIGNVPNSGIVSPGLSAGTLTVSGDYSQDSLSEPDIEVCGTTPGSQYDVLDVSGTATLGGKLKVTLGDGVTIPPDTELDIITAGSVSGQFATVEVPQVNGVPVFVVVYKSDCVSLVSASAPAAPIPGNVTLNSMTVDPDRGVNPAETELAIRFYHGTTYSYVQTDGTLGASAVWRTDATWAVKTVTGLSHATTYSVDVKARDGALVETDFGPAATATTKCLLSVRSTPVTGISIPGTHPGVTNYTRQCNKNYSITLTAPPSAVTSGRYFMFYRWTRNGSARTIAARKLVSTITSDTTAVATYKRFSSMRISGPTTVNESSSARYSLRIYWTGGTSSTMTSYATWSDNSSYAKFTSAGVLKTSSVRSNQKCRITASYAGKSCYLYITIRNR